MLRHNLGTKLLALLLGLALWMYGLEKTNPTAETSVFAEVAVENVPAGLAGVASPARLEVVLSGPAEKIAAIRSSPQVLSLVAEVSRLSAGEHQVPVSPRSVPAGVRLRAIRPPTVRVRLEPLQEKTMRLVFAPSGTPPNDYDPARVSLTPSVVRVRGLASELGRIATASVEVNIEELVRQGREVAQVSFRDPIGERLAPALASIEPLWVAVVYGQSSSAAETAVRE